MAVFIILNLQIVPRPVRSPDSHSPVRLRKMRSERRCCWWWSWIMGVKWSFHLHWFNSNIQSHSFTMCVLHLLISLPCNPFRFWSDTSPTWQNVDNHRITFQQPFETTPIKIYICDQPDRTPPSKYPLKVSPLSHLHSAYITIWSTTIIILVYSLIKLSISCEQNQLYKLVYSFQITPSEGVPLMKHKWSF